MGMMEQFKVVLIVMLFYSFCITLMAYATPEDAKVYVTTFSDLSNRINLKDTGTQIENSMLSQTRIPVLELGALIFYSGNIIIDLLLNFAFAIPQMIALLVNGAMILFDIDSYIFVTVELFASVVVMALYLLGLMQMLINIRSRGSVQ